MFVDTSLPGILLIRLASHTPPARVPVEENSIGYVTAPVIGFTHGEILHLL
jgi:hypothetical protein